MHQIRRKYKISYAHQLSSAYTKECFETIHGHTGVIEIFLSDMVLNKDGMLIDFSSLDDILGSVILKYDHALLMPKSMDSDYLDMLSKHNKKLVLFDRSPTAEILAEHIFGEVRYIMKSFPNIEVDKVRFHETEDGYAEYKIG